MLRLPVVAATTADWIRVAAGVVNRLISRVDALDETTDSRLDALEAPEVTAYIPTTAPGTPTDGMVYYDSGTNKLRVRASGAWVDLH